MYCTVLYVVLQLAYNKENFCYDTVNNIYVFDRQKDTVKAFLFISYLLQVSCRSSDCCPDPHPNFITSGRIRIVQN
jgi:hypothetical protein